MIGNNYIPYPVTYSYGYKSRRIVLKISLNGIRVGWNGQSLFQI